MPKKDSHPPGCPAALGVSWFQWAEPAAAALNVLPPAELVVYLPAESTSAVPFSAVEPAAADDSPPLYLSHCSLVI